MLKRVNKTTALLVAVTSVISSMSPVMASERLDANDGSIQNAVAFSDGKYVYDGNKDGNNSGIYYNDGTKEKLLDDVSEIDTDPQFGDNYVSASNNNKEYKINLSDGTVSNEDTKSDLESDAKASLQTKLKNTSRYGNDTEIKSFSKVADGQFGDNWYSYTATGNSAKYDNILGVPTNLAAGLAFTDEDSTEGKISGTVSITKATDEDDVDSYRVYYLDKNDIKVGSAIGTLSKTESSLQVKIDDTDIPSGATQLGVYSVNSKGESETATKLTIVDKGASVVTYKSQITVTVNGIWGPCTIAGQSFSNIYGVDALAAAINTTEFTGYTVKSTAVASGVLTIVFVTTEDLDGKVPDGFVTGLSDWSNGYATSVASAYDATSGSSTTDTSTTTTTDDSTSATTTSAAVTTDGSTNNTTTGAAVTTGSSTSTAAKTRITVNITNFWGTITIAGKSFSPTWSSDTMGDLASQIENTKFTGYTVESATSSNGAVTAIFTTTEELTEVPSGFTTGLDWSSGYGTVTVEPITLDTSITTDITTSASVTVTTTTGAAVGISAIAAGIVNTDNVLQMITKNLTVGVYYASATSSEDVTYFGYTDGNGNYIDCSKIANISVYDGKEVVKIDNFNDEVTKNGKTVKVGLPTLVETLGQDKDYIYNVISVPIVGSQTVNGTAYSDTDKETVYYLQKISKVKGSKQDGAYLPSKVESYLLNNDAGWTGGDNWSYMAAYYMLIGDDSSRKIKIVDGNIYVAHNDNNGTEVAFGRLKLSKSKRITPVNSTTTSSEVTEPLLYEDTADSTDMDTWTMDHNGNVWALYKGKIMKSAQGNEFQNIYHCDDAIDNINVYDDDNFIAWSDKEDLYITPREGESGKTVTKTGWHKLDDGTWHLYDISGNEVKGWTNFGSGWYYMNDKGAMQTGWLNNNEKWYYLADSGLMKTGWVNVDGKWYYLDQSGTRQENTTIDGYSLDSNGVWIQ